MRETKNGSIIHHGEPARRQFKRGKGDKGLNLSKLGPATSCLRWLEPSGAKRGRSRLYSVAEAEPGLVYWGSRKERRKRSILGAKGGRGNGGGGIGLGIENNKGKNNQYGNDYKQKSSSRDKSSLGQVKRGARRVCDAGKTRVEPRKKESPFKRSEESGGKNRTAGLSNQKGGRQE